MSETVKLSLEIPDSLADITLEQYQRYLKVVEQNKEDENATDFLNMKSLEVFCGLDLKYAHHLPIDNFLVALEHLGRCFEEDTPLEQSFMLRDADGQEHEMGFIPKLDRMSVGEYTDLDKYVSDWQQMHRAMAVLYRPIKTRSKKQYELYPYESTEEWADIMKGLPLNIVFGAVVFFYRLGMKLSESTLEYLKEEEAQAYTNKDSQENGDGFLALLRLQRETILRSMQQQRFHYTKQ